MKGKMEGDFQFGPNSNSLHLLSEVAVLVKNWREEDVEKPMAMAVRSCCDPLQGFGFDGYLVPDNAMVKITNRVSSSSSYSALDMLLQVTSHQLMEFKTANTFTGICIPKKKRTSLRRRTMPTFFPCTSHDSIPIHQIPRKKRSNLRRTRRAFLPIDSHDSAIQLITKAMQELERVLAEKGTVDFTLFPFNEIHITQKKTAKANAMKLCSLPLNSPSCSSISCISQDC